MNHLHRSPRAALTCFLFTITGLIAPAIAADTTQPAAPTLYLQTTKNPESLSTPLPILARELYRQAILIAARDGLGLQTRDESLREWRDAAPAGAWNFTCFKNHLDLTHGPSVWHLDQPQDDWWPAEAGEHVADIEPLSRVDFVKVLQANGFAGTGNTMKPGAAAPDDAEDRLADMEELSQFALLRETHDLIRHDGESEARLGVLVRAYANLGQLTRIQWSVEHDVFMARSMLYAQRMVANDPKSATALWHRAYAMAMAGHQGQAIADLAAAAPLAGNAKPPGWVALLDPYCHYDFQKLTTIATSDPDRAPLATFLAVLTIESSRCQAATLKIEQAAWDANPQCLRVIDAMCNVTGPGLLNQLAEDGPRVFSATLGQKLEKMPGLPQAVTTTIADVRKNKGPLGRDAICQALIDQGAPKNDSAEPSWAALGRMIQETTFALVRRKSNLIAEQWGVDASDYVAEVQPLIDGHPFKGLIDAYGAIHQPSNASAIDAIKDLKWEDLTTSELSLYYFESGLESRGQGTSSKLFQKFNRDRDPCSGDQEAVIVAYNGNLKGRDLGETTDMLLAVSPYSPWLVCNEIANQWNPAKAAELEKTRGDYPSIALALGNKYAATGKPADAERCLKKAIELSPDQEAYRALAKMYKSQKKDDLWLATMNDYLNKTDNVGLDHANVQVELANYYMARDEYQQAIPYADAAAGTGAAWGLSCAAKAHTGAGDYNAAEQLMIEEYQHYDGSPFNWLTWCMATGHGRRGDAFKAFHQYIDARGDSLGNEDMLQMAMVNVVELNPADAIIMLNKRYAKFPGPLSISHIIVIADESDDAAARNAAIKLADQVHDDHTLMFPFMNELKKAFPPGGNGALDLKAVDAIVKKGKSNQQIQVCILTARYLIKHGQKDAATDYVKRCYSGFTGYCVDNVLVYQTTRDLGLDPAVLAKPTTQPAK